MADKRISDLSSASTLTLADLLVLVNDAQTKKTTVADLLELIANQNQFAELDTEGKIPAELLPDSIFGAVTYKASWNANTNTPAIPTAAAENKGWYYVVETAGTTNVSGVAEWAIGDWLVSNGSTWQKVDNTDAVSSWNTRIGAVVPLAGDYTTDMVTEATSKYYTAARVLAEVLAGLTLQNTAITNADSILTAFGKAQGQINQRELSANKNAPGGYPTLDDGGKIVASQLPASVLGGVSYQGTWNAATNTILPGSTSLPTAISGNKGWYYIVSTPGSTNINGITDWKLGDWVISNGTTWDKVDNTDAISSWNGRVGAVVPGLSDYTTNMVAEAGTTYYYTGNRVRAEVLTGFATSTSAIIATDSVLAAFGKAQGQINLKEASANKGVANGYASLDSGTKIPIAQIPTSSINTSMISEVTNLYYTAARVRAEVLTGLNPVSGTIAATDSILTAFNKTAGALPAKENTANKGIANGYAGLGANSRISAANSIIGQNVLGTNFTGFTTTSTAEQTAYSIQIPASYFAAGDQFNIDVWMGANSALANKTIKVYFNTTNSLTSAFPVATYANTANFGSVKFSREIAFVTNTTMKAGCGPTISSLNGEYSGATDNTATTIPDVTAGFYVIVTLQKVNNSDGLKIDRVVVNGLLAP